MAASRKTPKPNESPDELQAHWGKLPERRRANDTDLEMLRVALDIGRATLENQRTELAGIRLRTVQYLAFVGASSAFLVGAGLKSIVRDDIFVYIGLAGAVLFIFALYLVFCILRGGNAWPPFRAPYKWYLNVYPGKVMSYLGYDIGRPTEAEFLDQLVNKYQSYLDINRKQLVVVRRVYWLFLIVLSVQLATWVGMVVMYR